ncbi:hypothetical protein [Dactylosporangium sp. CA-233914]|uniref:hypothetical protein n=1 Tax=Dactylosporangium sp. CA-233914 TaxID=3239934 RepID=UPI003D9258D3
MADHVVLGEITCPSSELVMMESGYLGLWSGERAPERRERGLNAALRPYPSQVPHRERVRPTTRRRLPRTRPRPSRSPARTS